MLKLRFPWTTSRQLSTKIGQDISTAQDLKTLLSTSKSLIIVDFWASWCGPCRLLTPILRQSIESFNENRSLPVHLALVNIDDVAEAASEHGVSALPTVVAFKGGREVGRFVGVKDSGAIGKFLSQLHQ
jgi:thioredoxin 1